MAPTYPVGALPRRSSLNAVTEGATTLRITGAVSSGKKRGRPELSERVSPQATPLLRKLRCRFLLQQLDMDKGWNHFARGGRDFKATTIPEPNPNPCLQEVT